MNQHSFILGLHAQTPIHAGAGSATGVIDLPIQREGHNGWPCIFGSSLKGALRARAETHWNTTESKIKTTTLFGPDTDNASDHAGALMIGDARLLLLPVRSLTSQFRWVTCPAALQRFAIDSKRFCDQQIPLSAEIKNLQDTKEHCAALVATTGSDTLFLEEYRFTTKRAELSNLISILASLMHSPTEATANLEQQLAIVSNDMFSHISQHATPVSPHIAIDSETKTVRNGALWYEETLPTEALLYSGILAVKGRTPHSADKTFLPMSAEDVGNNLTSLFKEHSWLQVGGNETVGMGWSSVQIMGA